MVFFDLLVNADYAKLEVFINSISNVRDVVIKLNTFERTIETYKSFKENILIYIRMINLINIKFKEV